MGLLVFIILPWLIYLCFPINNSLRMLQANSFNKKKYLKDLKKNIFKVFGGFNLLQIILFIYIWQFVTMKNFMTSILIFFFFYLLLALVSCIRKRKETKKIVYTPRVLRLIFSTMLVYNFMIIGLWVILKLPFQLILIFIAYFQHLLVLLILFINTPLEKLVEIKQKRP